MQRRNGVLTRDAFDTTDTGCSTRFTLNTEQADIPRTAGMRTATQFGREIAHRQHTNAVVILLAKQRHSTLLFRIIQCHNFGLNWQVATNLRIHQIFYLTNLLRLHRFKMREVETQVVVIDQRAFLSDMLAKTWRSAACSKCVAE